ncbi:MAG: indole-3-glycerol phosphate synthase TrpC [Chloroflexi bacterium]|nr:indole-3-glycerol phosphate synthase TrpC [Chloroflexota bacterium]
MSVLEEIVANKRLEVAARKRARPLEAVRDQALARTGQREFAAALAAPGLQVIAEIKRRSPAKGDLNATLDAPVQARRYQTAGAAAISVLTDEKYFNGRDDDLAAVRAAVDLPLLRKDFTVDPYQVWEARALGADALLLIVRALSQPELETLLALTTEAGLTALVEVHDAPELARAVAAGARVIGVNNRNLDTLTVDPETSLRLRSGVPADTIAVAESGISEPGLTARLAEAGFAAILVGEALVRAEDPGRLLRQLRGLPEPVAGGGGTRR